jgi:hypothetical protein
VGYALAKLGLRPPSTWLRRYCALLLKYKSGLYRNKTLLTQVSGSQPSATCRLVTKVYRVVCSGNGVEFVITALWLLCVLLTAAIIGRGMACQQNLLCLSCCAVLCPVGCGREMVEDNQPKCFFGDQVA